MGEGKKILFPFLRNCRRLIGYWAPANRRANTGGGRSDTILVGRFDYERRTIPPEVSGLAFYDTPYTIFYFLFWRKGKQVFFLVRCKCDFEAGASPRCGPARPPPRARTPRDPPLPSRRAGRGFGEFGQSRDEMRHGQTVKPTSHATLSQSRLSVFPSPCSHACS